MNTFTKKLTLLTVLACAAVSTTPTHSSDVLNSISKNRNLVIAGFIGIWSSLALYSLWNAKSQPVNKDSIDKASIDEIAQAITDINNAFDAAAADKDTNNAEATTEVETTTTENDTQIAQDLALEAQSLNLIELVIFATKSTDHAKAALIKINRIIAYQKEDAKKHISLRNSRDPKSWINGKNKSNSFQSKAQDAKQNHEIKCQKEREAAAERYYDYK